MIPALLLIFSAVAYRVTTGLLIHSGATWLSNFTPLAAIALCSAAYFPAKYKAITNAFAWLTDPGYAKNFAGLIQALTVGLPQYSATPSWMFFRNSLLGDLLFTLLFVVCMSFGRNAEQSRARPAVPRTA